MIVVSPTMGAAMAEAVERVNRDKTPQDYEQHIAELERTVRQLKEQLANQKATIQEYQAARDSAAPESRWVVTSEWLKAHPGVSSTYLNRGLNGKEGYHLSQPGRQSATGRWLVNSAAEFSHRKKSKPSK